MKKSFAIFLAAAILFSFSRICLASDLPSRYPDNTESSKEFNDLYADSISSGSLSHILAISALIGAAAAIIVLTVFYRGMKKIKIASEANSYVVPGSFKIRKSRDYYLYSTVTRIRRDSKRRGGRPGFGGGRPGFGGGRPGGGGGRPGFGGRRRF